MIPPLSHQPKMVRSATQLTPVRFTEQQWADLNGLVLSRGQMIENGLRVENFNTHELAQLRRCLLCRRMSPCNFALTVFNTDFANDPLQKEFFKSGRRSSLMTMEMRLNMKSLATRSLLVMAK